MAEYQEVELLFEELKKEISGIKGLENVDPRDFYNRIISTLTSVLRES